MNTKTIIIFISIFLAMLGVKWGYELYLEKYKLQNSEGGFDQFTFEKYVAGNTAYLFLLDKTDGRTWSLKFDKEGEGSWYDMNYYPDTYFPKDCLFSILTEREITDYIKGSSAKDRLYRDLPEEKLSKLRDCKSESDKRFREFLDSVIEKKGQQPNKKKKEVQPKKQ